MTFVIPAMLFAWIHFDHIPVIHSKGPYLEDPQHFNNSRMAPNQYLNMAIWIEMQETTTKTYSAKTFIW